MECEICKKSFNRNVFQIHRVYCKVAQHETMSPVVMTSSLKEKDDRIQELELKLETELAVLKEYIQELELQLDSSAKFYLIY